MKSTLSTSEAVSLLMADENAAWTMSGARTLVEHLEQVEEDCGEETEFDRVALRCEFNEYESLIDWADQHFANYREDFGIEYINPMTGESEDQSVLDCDGNFHDEVLDSITRYIQDHGQLIEFDGGIIVSEF